MHHRHTAVAIAAATVLTLAGCTDDSTDKKPVVPGAQGVDAAKQGDKAPAPVAVGQPVKIERDGKSIELTAVQVVDPATSTGFSRVLGANERLIAVQWKITAGTTVASEYPAMTSGLYDDQGQRYAADAIRKVTAGPSYPDGTAVNPGTSTLGYVAYIVPATAKITKIQYSPGLGLAQNAGTWNL